ncbi:hypothetical protein [Actinoplanes utahensis]|uniref:Uncharacterized protein n=1 Tax=Actinoplanes utahensis TaxID=1869 RepID=A0A0A6UGJ5_ACTUT|nr:hypothetical protein [Actinoplanes utahensis]KHD74581.1 hypothetical protein MB27_27660 [Actinoplanes utahensis]GIF27679.1 hypothetical protein Aut01nite_06650 [Actinoplanes utahensis]
MRRTALYLGGLFLATGATLAMAGPAMAADGKCPKTVAVSGYNANYGTGVAYGYAQPVHPVAVVPVGYTSGYGVGGYGVGGYGLGGGYDSSINNSQSITQGSSLANIAVQGIDVL